MIDTYRWELCIAKLWVTDVVNLWVKDWNDLFWAHAVHLEFKVGYHVEILTAWGHLRQRRNQWRPH